MTGKRSQVDALFEVISRRREAILETYRPGIKRGRHELDTPALLLDLNALRHNIGVMADWTREHARVRPHAKVHKCAEIARRQIEAGAVGITTATLWEAAVMIHAGLDNILIANQIMDAEKLSLLAQLAGKATMLVGVDSPESATALAAAIGAAGAQIGVLIEVDVGMGRGGVRSVEEARAVARAVAGQKGLQLRGMMSWEGHTTTERDKATRAHNAAVATEKTLACVAALEKDGHPIEIVSAGGTNTYDMTGANPRVTEIQAGTYVIMDTSYVLLSPAFRPVLSVLGTVVSRHGARAVLNCGIKVHAVQDIAPPRPLNVPARVFEVHEEHTLLDLEGDVHLKPGDRVEMLVSYSSGTVNLHDAYYVADGDAIVDVWPILGRGHGFGPM